MGDTEHTCVNPQQLRSFGRRKGRVLSKAQQTLLETVLPLYSITEERLQQQPAQALEIGFGAGEHLLTQARQSPETMFIGCEPYMNGVVSLLQQVEKQPLPNLMLWTDDARDLLARLPAHQLESIFILFPDPWPKTRHHKRRLVTKTLLETLHSKAKPGCQLLLATDHTDYAGWMLAHVLSCPGWNWTARVPTDWNIPPKGWVKTRYQEKAEAEGRSAMFFISNASTQKHDEH